MGKTVAWVKLLFIWKNMFMGTITLVCGINMLQVIVILCYHQQETTNRFGNRICKKHPFKHPCEFTS